jgi:hypothetical protein
MILPSSADLVALKIKCITSEKTMSKSSCWWDIITYPMAVKSMQMTQENEDLIKIKMNIQITL